MKLDCPYCGERFPYRSDLAGQSIECSWCKKPIKMPTVEELSAEDREEFDREQEKARKREEKAQRKQEAKEQREQRWAQRRQEREQAEVERRERAEAELRRQEERGKQESPPEPQSDESPQAEPSEKTAAEPIQVSPRTAVIACVVFAVLFSVGVGIWSDNSYRNEYGTPPMTPLPYDDVPQGDLTPGQRMVRDAVKYKQETGSYEGYVENTHSTGTADPTGNQEDEVNRKMREAIEAADEILGEDY